MIINICHLYGNLLNTYGDVGNIMALKYFAQKKGHEVNIEVVSLKDEFDYRKYDFVFFGGGQDYEQSIVEKDLESKKENLIKYLIPKAYIVTPNVPEAEEISSIKIETVEDMKKAGNIILNMGPKYVLMKGGHLEGDCVDVLIGKDMFEVFKGERINRKNTHGTGCTISSAITSHLALGYDIKESIRLSKEYITEAIKYSFDIGHGVGPVHHFYKEDK